MSLALMRATICDYRETVTPHPTPLPMGEGADRARGASSMESTRIGMKRRAVISLLVGTAAALAGWPFAARAQQIPASGRNHAQRRAGVQSRSFNASAARER